ncbi:MAG: JAB domain-containing protein, partial [Clostridia bacterium]|nr:JAB domain-containing protein [Clostridia bacterium]
RAGEGAFLREVVTLAVRYHAKQVILVRVRKNARGKHTTRDIRLAERLREILGRMEVFLKDDLLLSGQNVSSLRAAHVLNETDDFFAAMRTRTEERWFV